MSGKISVSRIPTRPQGTLPRVARADLISLKQRIRAGENLERFKNERGGFRGDGPPLPNPDAGCVYFEAQVGSAHEDAEAAAGRWRLVFEVHLSSREIREIYFTEEHYQKFTFERLV